MNWRRSPLIALAAWGLIVPFCWPAAAAPPKPRPTIRVPFWPTTASVKLDEKVLKATVDGVETKVLNVRRPGEELLIILIVDLVEDLTLADLVKQSLAEAVNTLPEKAFMAVMRSQDGLQVLVDPTADRAALNAAIQGISVTGKAGFLETVETALQVADSIAVKSGIRGGGLLCSPTAVFPTTARTSPTR